MASMALRLFGSLALSHSRLGAWRLFIRILGGLEALSLHSMFCVYEYPD